MYELSLTELLQNISEAEVVDELYIQLPDGTFHKGTKIIHSKNIISLSTDESEILNLKDLFDVIKKERPNKRVLIDNSFPIRWCDYAKGNDYIIGGGVCCSMNFARLDLNNDSLKFK